MGKTEATGHQQKTLHWAKPSWPSLSSVNHLFSESESRGKEGIREETCPWVGTAGLVTGKVLASFPQSSEQQPIGHPLMAQRHPARMAAVPPHKVTFWWELL